MALATGGSGGSGSGGNTGGNGPGVSLIDAVSGATRGGYLYGKQGAYGGSGGFGFDSGGAPGSATSVLNLSDARAGTITGVSIAQGGASGGSTNGSGYGGAATADATVSGTQTVAAIAKATGGAVGPAQAFGGGPGGAATAGATATTTSTHDSAYVLVVAQGAEGGLGGAGGVATVTPSSASGYNAYVKASQIGGAGEAGGNYGGAGAASTMVNVVSGQTRGGTLSLYQRAVGGAGGLFPQGAIGAAGGAADSSLTFDDTANPIHASQVTGAVIASGGDGGSGYSGGQANASLVLTGAAAVTATTTAHGGAGQLAGHASAKTKAVGTSGTLSASADTASLPGQLIQSGSALAADTVDGDMSAKAKVVIGPAALDFSTTAQALATQNAAPDAATTAPVLSANANIAAAFGASPSFFAVDELGGSYAKSGGTASETTTDTIDLTVGLTQLASRQNLVAGFYGATGLGTGFSSLTFTLTGDGAQLFTETFTTLVSAENFFSDNAMDL